MCADTKTSSEKKHVKKKLRRLEVKRNEKNKEKEKSTTENMCRVTFAHTHTQTHTHTHWQTENRLIYTQKRLHRLKVFTDN